MTVKVFKMISGEEIITTVVSESETTYELDAPAAIRLQKTESGVGVGLIPYMPYADGKISLRVSAVAATGYPDQNLENEYRRLFGSGIEIVSAVALSSNIQLP